MLLQRISVAPSVLIAVAISIVHAAAAVALWLTPVPVLGKAALSLAIALSFLYFMARDAALHTEDAIVALEIREEGGIACRTRDGAWLDCELRGASFVSYPITVVSLRARGSRRARRIILVPDNVDPNEFRRLRTWLRWKGGKSVQAVDY